MPLFLGRLLDVRAYNREQLDRLLAIQGPLKFFDVNLRPPFADFSLITQLAKRADVLKLNDGEVGQFASWLRTGDGAANIPRNEEAISEACAVVAEATNVLRICVTRAEQGAAFWQRGKPLVTAPAPHIVVKDTVGAGDAFMSGLMIGITSGADIRTVLENACRLGAFVASQNGATPLLSDELVQEFNYAKEA